MSRPNPVRLFPALTGALLLLATAASATELTNAWWDRNDLMIRFSDSAAYTIDLAESDTSQLVIRFRNTSVADQELLAGPLGGPSRREAILTGGNGKELRLTVRSDGRLGYASLWRPYSRTLVVHTFTWDRLGYPEEQYYKGLLALEQGLGGSAEELLGLSYATGEERAGSALGVYLARRGDYARAAQYLRNPVNPDDYAALAATERHSGDSAAALGNQARFEQMLAQTGEQRKPGPGRKGSGRNPRRAAGQGGGGSFSSSPNPNEQNGNMMSWDNPDKWLYLGGGVLLLLLLIGLIIWLTRKSSRKRGRVSQPPPPPPPARVVQPVSPRTGPGGPTAERPRTETVEVRTVNSQPAPVAQPVPVQQPEPEPAPQPVATAQPTPAEPVIVEQTPTVETPVAQPPVETAPAPEPVPENATAPVAENIPPAPEARPYRSTPTQAADLRRRIEAMRANTAAQPAAKKPPVDSDEPTISEARRLQLSRDSVELRRRMNREGR